ncbi:MAG TPA: porin family protein [Bacteroidales bacterium]|nr:porin family protein [Bacteroidales bacterium]HPS16610.1 porin family protein [Bacteroidales bacterium]
MKKKYGILFFVFTIFSFSGFAQQSKTGIGFYGGFGLRNLRGNEIIKEKNTSAFGYCGGFSFQFNISEKYTVCTAIAYERKGAVGKSQQTDTSGNIISEIKTFSNFDYITIPLLFRYNIQKKVNFFFEAGGFAAYLLQQKFVVDDPVLTVNTADNTDNDKRMDYGFSFGLGLSKPISNRLVLSVELHDNLGIYNVSKVHVYNDGTIKTNNTNILIGLSYNFGKHD